MRARIAVMVVVVALSARCQLPPTLFAADAPRVVTGDTVVGAWNGQWTAAPAKAEGPVELILARIPGRDGVVGQFTFVVGGISRTLRYEGELEDGRLQFPLVGGGRIVLQPGEPARPGDTASLHGEWVDSRGALPGPEGRLQLRRVR